MLHSSDPEPTSRWFVNYGGRLEWLSISFSIGLQPSVRDGRAMD
jgi:hypothetical protein